MAIYKVYFEIYGKKLMKKLEASNREDAKQKIASSIVFHKITHDIDPDVQNIANLLGIKL